MSLLIRKAGITVKGFCHRHLILPHTHYKSIHCHFHLQQFLLKLSLFLAFRFESFLFFLSYNKKSSGPSCFPGLTHFPLFIFCFLCPTTFFFEYFQNWLVKRKFIHIHCHLYQVILLKLHFSLMVQNTGCTKIFRLQALKQLAQQWKEYGLWEIVSTSRVFVLSIQNAMPFNLCWLKHSNI